MSQWADVDGSDYESGRPEWPSEVETFLTGTRTSGAIETAVDLGAGTGNLTRHLAAVASAVIAVDPAPDLLAVLQDRLPHARTVLGHAEAIPVPGASADAVAAGNALHWFDADAAAAEIARILRPGGIVAILWNRPNWPEWFDELRQLLEDYRNPVADAAARRAETGEWRHGLEQRSATWPASASAHDTMRGPGAGSNASCALLDTSPHLTISARSKLYKSSAHTSHALQNPSSSHMRLR